MPDISPVTGAPVLSAPPVVDSVTPLTTAKPQQTPPQNFREDTSSSSTAVNKSCLAKIWDAICNFFRSACFCLRGRNKQETATGVKKPNEDTPLIPTPKGAGKAEDSNSPEEPSVPIKPTDPTLQGAGQSEDSNLPKPQDAGQLEDSNPPKEPNTSTQPSACFSSEAHSETDRMASLLELVDFSNNVSAIRVYLREWVQGSGNDKEQNSRLICETLGIKRIDDFDMDHKIRLVDFLKAQLKALREQSKPGVQTDAPSSLKPSQQPTPASKASLQPEDHLKVETFVKKLEKGKIAGLSYFKSGECGKPGRKAILIHLAKNFINSEASIKQVYDYLYQWVEVDHTSGQAICTALGVVSIYNMNYAHKDALITFLNQQ